MFRAIVVGTDGPASAKRAVDHAAELARGTGAVLHVVRAFKLLSVAAAASPEAMSVAVSGTSDAEVVAHVQAELEQLADELAGYGIGVNAHAEPAQGAAAALLSIADEVSADLPVVGNRGMKGVRRVLGSVPTASPTRRIAP